MECEISEEIRYKKITFADAVKNAAMGMLGAIAEGHDEVSCVIIKGSGNIRAVEMTMKIHEPEKDGEENE